MSMDYYIEKADVLIGDSFEAKLNEVSSDRRERISAYKLEDDRRRSLAATLLLERALAKYGVKEKDMSYALGEYGKPYFRNYDNIRFSLSHSGDYAAVVVSDCEVGCDIQKVDERSSALADRFFTDSERAYIRSTEDFFRVWTLKESFIKAIGKGLHIPLHAFSIENLSAQPFVLFENVKYTFIEKDMKGYKFAVCTKAKEQAD